MYSIDPHAMQRMEQSFLIESGYPGLLLMEQAAQQLLYYAQNYVNPGQCCVLLCGTGNNGGDAYALARLLMRDGIHCKVFASGIPKTDDAGTMRRLLESVYAVEVQPLHALSLESAALIVDGLFGTGFTGAVSEELAVHICSINESTVPVLSIDVPSGLDARTGYVENIAIVATETVTFHRPKHGLFLSHAPKYIGKLQVVDIGIPASWDREDGMLVIDHAAAQALLPKLSPIAHKGNMGSILILAGSSNMAGAACIAARGARVAGGGLISVASNAHCVSLIQQTEPTVMGHVLSDKAAEEAFLDRIAKADCLVMGSGLDQSDTTSALVCAAIERAKNANIPCVLDAQALNILAEAPQKLPSHFVLTPHPGEAARMLRCTVEDVLRDYAKACAVLHEKYGAVILLKGARSLIYDGTNYATHNSGSPLLAKGGSGDALSGILGAMLAKNFVLGDTLHKTALACYIFGRASELAALKKGEYAGNALDAIEYLAQAVL